MSYFLECRREISFYIKEFTFLSWIRGFFPNCGHLFECSFLVLLSTFSFPQRYFAHTGRDVYFFYTADIVSRCAKIYPQWIAFSFVRKNKHTEKQRNKHTFQTIITNHHLLLTRGAGMPGPRRFKFGMLGTLPPPIFVNSIFFLFFFYSFLFLSFFFVFLFKKFLVLLLT